MKNKTYYSISIFLVFVGFALLFAFNQLGSYVDEQGFVRDQFSLIPLAAISFLLASMVAFFTYTKGKSSGFVYCASWVLFLIGFFIGLIAKIIFITWSVHLLFLFQLSALSTTTAGFRAFWCLVKDALQGIFNKK